MSERSFAGQLRKKLQEKNEAESSRELLAEEFNKATSKLIYEFLREVESGNIRIDDTADIMRLFQIFKEVNDIDNMAGEGTGSLPPLSPKQSSQIKSFVDIEEEENSDGEEESYINPNSLSELSAEDIGKMMNEREIQMNEDNAREWGSEGEVSG